MSSAIGVVAAVALLLIALPAQICRAHPAQLVAANAKIDADGRFHITAKFDLLAFVLNDTPARIDDGPMNALLDGPDDILSDHLRDASERFVHGTTVLCGAEHRVVRADAIQFSSVADVHRWRDSGIRPRLPVIQEVSIEGSVPSSTSSVAFRFPEVMGAVVLTVERPGEEPFSEPLEAGCASSMLAVHLRASDLRIASPAQTAAEPNRLRVAVNFLSMGFTHILPRGPDHILFVLGLFLLSTQLRSLLWQVTAFTLAHSITLALALYGVVRLPGMIVEPLIAASIALVAFENLVTSNLKPWRPFVVFGFGLVHGLGFAGVLSDVGLPRSQFATALVTFNVGVELGQLSIIVLAFMAVGWWRQCAWYRRAVVLPASGAIAAIAVFWTIQRLCAGA
jgi:hypothetical protein